MNWQSEYEKHPQAVRSLIQLHKQFDVCRHAGTYVSPFGVFCSRCDERIEDDEQEERDWVSLEADREFDRLRDEGEL